MPTTSTVSVAVTFSNNVTLAHTFTKPPNENSPGVVDYKLFPIGFTALVLPPGTVKGVIIVPPTDSINPLKVAGLAGDQGVPISASDPTYIALSGVPILGIKVETQPTPIRLIWV